jgi:hypothetical protein
MYGRLGRRPPLGPNTPASVLCMSPDYTVLKERLNCECSSKVSIYTRGRGQEDDDDDPQQPLYAAPLRR